MDFTKNLILNTDSYKASHWLQFAPGTTGMFSYIASRGGAYGKTLFFGLQILLKEYLTRPVTHADVDEARELFAAHGEPFNEAGWRHVVDVHGGLLPVRIRAVPEGTLVPTQQVLATIECTDPRCFWVVSYIETLLLRAWYPVTVATNSWHIRQVIQKYLDDTCDDPAANLPFKLHDFGARGVSSAESAAIGGVAHLVNFEGTDTVAAVLAARRYYHEPMAAFSIPAAEHSTITSWGKERELDAYRNMLTRFAKPGAVLAVVSDSYDIFHAVQSLWGQALRQQVIDSGATVVIRPDSGDPETVVLAVAERLERAFGSTVNRKGYRVLDHVRIIQGDGVDLRSIRAILAALAINGFSAENVAFGMGGALLQRVDRDTQRFAMKCSAVLVDGQWRDVFKDPVTDAAKKSLKGRVSLWRNRSSGEFVTAPLPDATPGRTDAGHVAVDGPEWEEMLVDVFENGRMLRDWTLAEIRARADVQPLGFPVQLLAAA